MDARSLLRAKKEEARIEHPYAAYSARGDLRCSICAIPAMQTVYRSVRPPDHRKLEKALMAIRCQSEMLILPSVKQWDAHLLTKQHRTSAAREKAEQAARAVKSAPPQAKRSAAGDEGDGQAGPSKRAKTGPAGLPEGFFSKGNVPVDGDDDEEGSEEDGGNGAVGTTGTATTSGPSLESTTQADPTGDTELDDFLASLSGPAATDNTTATAGAPAGAPAEASTYTVQGNGPRKNVPKYKELEPGQASYEAAPVRTLPAGEDNQEGEQAEPEESEKERRDRLAREEREEIVRRLEEEERAQEDADSRVSSLKERMALLKKRREAKAGASKDKDQGKAKVNGASHA